MNRQEFEQLRDLPGKRITADIEFIANKSASPNLTFDSIRVENELGLDVFVNGTYKPGIPAFTFNFRVGQLGPICRVSVNNMHHKGIGRTHKNDLQDEADPRLNLPTAIARPDLEGKSVEEVWRILCRQALIEHSGKFIVPTELV
jgi:hypothetical protein